LEARALRPVEWFNLASVHSPWKHDLHDDFYGRSGKAYQPEEAVVREPGLMRAPTLKNSAKTPARLFAYAFTRHFLEPEMVAAFHDLDPDAVLAELETCLQNRTPNPRNVFMAYGIAADVLGSRADDFVRRALPSVTIEDFPGLARAAAACLPREEALTWVLTYLDGLDAEERFDLRNSLVPFADERVLDWMERHAGEIETAVSWQGLAAFSSFSWERARAWLRAGRPLSLVALGALREGLGLNRLRSPSGEPPAPVSFPSAEEVFAELDAYLERDRAPNPRDQVADLKSALIYAGFGRETVRWVETQNPRVRAKVDVGKLSPDLHALIATHIDAKPKSPLRRMVAEILAGVILEWDAREGDRDGDHAAPISPEFLAKVSKPFLKELYEQIKLASEEDGWSNKPDFVPQQYGAQGHC
jgi:hypothetical protein